MKVRHGIKNHSGNDTEENKKKKRNLADTNWKKECRKSDCSQNNRLKYSPITDKAKGKDLLSKYYPVVQVIKEIIESTQLYSTERKQKKRKVHGISRRVQYNCTGDIVADFN